MSPDNTGAHGRASPDFQNRGFNMLKRYAPVVPNSQWHRPGDTDYLRELLAAAGLSQRAAGPLIGMSERNMRYKVSGEQDLSYPEQYCLEVLADYAQATGAVPSSPPKPAKQAVGTVWYTATERPLGAVDVGKIVLGKDRFGATVLGKLIKDSFGLVLQEIHNQPADSHSVPVDRVETYTLIDPPEAKP